MSTQESNPFPQNEDILEELESLPLTRIQKSVKTKQKIISTAMALLRRQGYEQLTVRNICKLAKVSNGTFYHFFPSKDDLMFEYLRQSQTQCPQDYGEIGLMDIIIGEYLDLVDRYAEMGLDFTASYFTAKNQAFNMRTRPVGGFVTDRYKPSLIEARQNGFVHEHLSIDGIIYDIQVIVIGNIFQWCVVGGASDVKSDLDRMLREYLISVVLTDAYFEQYPSPERALRAVPPG